MRNNADKAALDPITRALVDRIEASGAASSEIIPAGMREQTLKGLVEIAVASNEELMTLVNRFGFDAARARYLGIATITEMERRGLVSKDTNLLDVLAKQGVFGPTVAKSYADKNQDKDKKEKAGSGS